MLVFFIGITPLAMANTSKARLYQVDIIIFKNNNANYLPPEKPYALWKKDFFSSDVLLLTKQATDTNSKNTLETNLEPSLEPNLNKQTTPSNDQQRLLNILSSQEQLEKNFQLKTALENIKASDQYHVLYVASWVSDFYYGKTKSFNFSSDKAYQWPSGNHLYRTSAQRTEYTNGQNFTPEFPELNGLFSFSLNKYFDITIKLQILSPNFQKQKPIKLYGTSELYSFTPLKAYHIEQHIRTRSKKLIYIDNPNYGILLYLTPIKQTTQENQASKILEIPKIQNHGAFTNAN